jgi:hypothetical protein
MKLSKIILENKKVVERSELNISEKEVETLVESITANMVEYFDLPTDITKKAVQAAIKDLLI